MGEITRFEKWWMKSLLHRLHVKRLMPSFLSFCPEPFRGEVLEVGAGVGITSRKILDSFPQVELTAVDLDSCAEKSFKAMTSVYGQRFKYQRADILNLPFDRSKFDIVVAVHVIHHISNIRKAVREFLRVARPGGLIGIADENQKYVIWPLGLIWRAENNFNRNELENILIEEGAEILVAKGNVHFSIWARKPYPVQDSE